MRKARIKAENGIGCYHVMSRIVDRDFKMDGDEREIFRRTLRKVAAFSGVDVLTYAILSNHFHILLTVPEQPVLDDPELLRRITALHGAFAAQQYRTRWEAWRHSGLETLLVREQNQLRRRMGDVSPFMKLLKQLYTVSFNRRHRRTGTLWEGRYSSILVEDERGARSTVAAYIDLNPVRAGIVKDPAAYRWSGYGEACGGSILARQGICAVHGSGSEGCMPSWEDAAAFHRALIYTQGEGRQTEDAILARPGFSPEEAQAVLAQGGKLPLPVLLHCRVRYFRDGLAFGSKAFVESVFEKNRGHFGLKRKSGARRMRFTLERNFYVARALRVEPVRVPLRA